jgi:glycerophosphoryl diester phosphodiesterase
MAARGYDLQGHRGARGLKPENTIPAFETALDYGVDTLELDLHWSADDQLIVWHDPVIDPKKCHIPDDAPASLRIRDLTAEQLGHFVCDLNPDPGRFTDQTADPTELAGARYGIATLAHVLDFVDQYAAADVKPGPRRSNARIVRFNFETKRGDGAIADGFDGTNAGPFETALVEMLRQRSLEQRATIQSFDHRSLWAIRALQPRITLSALTEEGVVPDLEELQSRGATVWSPNYEDLTADIVAKAHAIGIRVIPWTVNDPQAMTELLQIGVDGLITDRPDLAPATR